MEWYQTELDQISNIKDFYVFLDQHALKLSKDHDLLDAIIRYRGFTSSDEEKKYLQFEIWIFSFQILSNNLFSSSVGFELEPHLISKFPTISSLDLSMNDYIQNRAKSCQNNYLKARYNHILWKGRYKNNSYAKEAIAHYLACIRDASLSFRSENDGFASFIGGLHENILALGVQIKQEPDDIQKITETILNGNNLPFWLKNDVVKNMLNAHKLFNPKSLFKCLSLFENEMNSGEIRDDFYWIHNVLPNAISLAQKTKTDKKKWINEIGYANLRLAESTLNDREERAFIKAGLYKDAINAFSESGNKLKKEETEQKYFDLKPQIKLTHFQIPYDDKTISLLQENDKFLKAQAGEVLKNKSDYVYSLIGKGSFFPRFGDVEKASNEYRIHFLDFTTALYFDENKNLSNRNEFDQRIFEVYNTRVDYTLLPFLHYIIITGIANGRLTAKNLIKHLVLNSWIGKRRVSYDLDGGEIHSNWIYLIYPALSDFFNQVLASKASKYYRPSFVLCTDSLALKLEGLFRDFSARFGVSTTKKKKSGLEEVQIHDIISNDTMRKYFNEDDFLFFNYVFSKEGLNIRNNIAHCLYHENEYHPDKMLLLIAILLRIGKYNIVKKNK